MTNSSPSSAEPPSQGARQAFQTLVLKVFASKRVRKLLSTKTGRKAFECAYWLYKDVIETPGTDVLAKHLPPGAWAVDVGANIGYFTTKFARWVSDGGRVLALEPEQDNYVRLSERLQREGIAQAVSAIQAAATETSGEVRLLVKPEHPGDHSLTKDGGIAIPGFSLDDLVAQHGNPRVGLIKVDTQGAEMQVLRGAKSLIAKDKPAIFIEIDDRALKGFDASAQGLVDLLREYGYVFHLIKRNHIMPISADLILSRLASQDWTYVDVLCVAERPAV